MIERGSIPEGREKTEQEVYENRYQRFYVWEADSILAGQRMYSFTPPQKINRRKYVILAAVGWHLKPHSSDGVILAAPLGPPLTAYSALAFALDDRDGLHLASGTDKAWLRATFACEIAASAPGDFPEKGPSV